MDDLEQAQALLERHGWKVERPPFDDPYEIMFRRMMQLWAGNPEPHPADDYMHKDYEWMEHDVRALSFLKEHFVLKTEFGK